MVGIVLAPAFLAALVASALTRSSSLEGGDSAGQGLLMLVVLVLLAGLAAAGRRAASTPRAPPPGAARLAPATVLGGGRGWCWWWRRSPRRRSRASPRGVPRAGADPARLGSIDTNRYRYWEVALETWADDPMRGRGLRRLPGRVAASSATAWTSPGDAHSLYIETAAELGLVGWCSS